MLSICQPTLKNDRKLKKICEPLLQGFGIDTFWYYSISCEGELTYISNSPMIAEYFYSNELYKGHPYFKTPRLLKTGFFFNDKESSEYSSSQGKMKNYVEMDQLFMLMDVGAEKAEGYGFALTNSSQDLSNKIINNLYCLKKFISYFQKEAEKEIKELGKYSLDLKKTCDSFCRPTNYFNDLASSQKIAEFLKKIDPIQFHRLNSLSEREKECIKWLLKGMTAVQIGKKLYLSNRTVESYIESIKNKLGCRTKKELFDVLIDYPFFP